MGYTSPYGPHNYMGEHADDAAVLTYIRNREWDDAADGTGNPQNGMTYYNTTSHVLKLYANGAWVILSTS